MWLAYVMILVLWIAFFAHYWATRQQLDEMRSQIEELAASFRGETSARKE